ncbi:ABC transporter ATP-binding protein, partial [Rhizobium ruizarguesonis]
LYNKPANRFVAGFIDAPHITSLDGAIVGHKGGFAAVETAGGHRLSVLATETRPMGERVSIGIRPQHITLADVASAGRGDTRVTLVEELGAETVGMDDG